MKLLPLVFCLATFPAMAVYQPTKEEADLLVKLTKGTEQTLKYALPLQGKAEICRYFIDSYRRENPQFNYQKISAYLLYWGIVQGNAESALSVAYEVLPQLYYYQHKLYEKYGKYPKTQDGIKQLFENAKNDDYLNLNEYININQLFKENLRKKNLSDVCMTSLGDGTDAEKLRSIAQATTSVDKLYYPGFIPSTQFNNVHSEQRRWSMILWQLRNSYY